MVCWGNSILAHPGDSNIRGSPSLSLSLSLTHTHTHTPQGTVSLYSKATFQPAAISSTLQTSSDHSGLLSVSEKPASRALVSFHFFRTETGETHVKPDTLWGWPLCRADQPLWSGPHRTRHSPPFHLLHLQSHFLIHPFHFLHLFPHLLRMHSVLLSSQGLTALNAWLWKQT